MAKAKKPTLEDLEESVAQAAEKLPPPNLSLGCDLLDLAVSGKVGAALGPGRYAWFQGSSSSGKSFLTLAVLAEAAKNPYYNKHQLIYIDKELGASFDMARFFGRKAAGRIAKIQDVESLEGFYDRMTAMMKKGPIVAVLDSFDALLPEAQVKAIAKAAKDREAGKEIDQSYNMEAGKIHSSRLRQLVGELGDTGSIFLGISQTRDNVGGGLYGPKNRTSGGRSLKFWSSVEVESAVGGKLEKEVNGTKREVGRHIRLKIAKNRISGKNRDVTVVFVPTFGIDQTGSNIDFLLEEKYLQVHGGRIETPWFEATYYREDLIRKIENESKETELTEFLQQSWDDLESKLTLPRKPRYE